MGDEWRANPTRTRGSSSCHGPWPPGTSRQPACSRRVAPKAMVTADAAPLRTTFVTTIAHCGLQAARSVKWLNKVRISDEEAYSTWVRGFAYKSMGHANTFEGRFATTGAETNAQNSWHWCHFVSVLLMIDQVWTQRSCRRYRNCQCNQQFV